MKHRDVKDIPRKLERDIQGTAHVALSSGCDLLGKYHDLSRISALCVLLDEAALHLAHLDPAGLDYIDALHKQIANIGTQAGQDAIALRRTAFETLCAAENLLSTDARGTA